jgi:hypothetical protein
MRDDMGSPTKVFTGGSAELEVASIRQTHQTRYAPFT